MKPFSEYVQNGPLTTEQLLAFARSLAAGVSESHALDEWRGDLTADRVQWDGGVTVTLPETPERLLLDDLDLDLHAIRGAAAIAAVGYLAPEQCADDGEPTPRSDVFQIGVLLFEAATGEHPFDDPRGDQIVDNIVGYEPRPPGHYRTELPVEWDGIIACCLHKRPEQRFASALDIAAQIARLERSGGTARKKPFELRWGRVVGAALVIVAVVLLVLWLTGVL